MKPHKHYVRTAAIALAVAISGCSNEPPPPPPKPIAVPSASIVAPKVELGVTIQSIALGTAIGADKRVVAPIETFSKNDTIYVAVDTSGEGQVTIKAKWTFHGDKKVADVGESFEPLYASGSTVSSFPLSKPAAWPSGNYHVEVFVDDKPGGIKNFSVK